MLLGKRIAAARQARGWSRSDLARKASVDPSYVTRIEEALYKRPSVDKVTRLADALGVRVTELTDPSPIATTDPIAADLAALFEPDEAPTVAEILKAWSRPDRRTRRYLLDTMRPLVLGVPDPEPRS